MNDKLRKDWAFASLVKDLNYVKTGVSVFNGKKEYYSTGSIKDKTSISEGLYSFAEKPSRANRCGQLGDVLQARMKYTDKAIIISDNFSQQLFSTGFIQIRPSKETLISQYLFYYFKSKLFLNEKDENCSGSTQSALNDKSAQNILIPIAPLPIQRGIVLKIEVLFSDLDNGIAEFIKAQEQLNIFRQAVLKKAFEGKITKEWRALRQAQGTPLPTAEELLQQIKEERQNHYNQQIENWKKAVKEWGKNGQEDKKPIKPKKAKELQPLSNNEIEELPNLPKEWMWYKTGSLCQKIQIGPFGTQLHKHDYKNEGIPIINPKHIKDQKINPQIYISKAKANSLSQYILKTNDVILGRRGEMGRTALITEKQNNWFCGTGSLYIRLGNKFIGKLYSLILSERRVVNYLNKKGSGTTMTNLNSTIINELPIQLISFSEQIQIIQKIESRLSVCDKMEQSIKESLEKANALRQSILKKAFEGKLLTEQEIAQCKQEPDYEPASVLLEKIKAERKRKKTTISILETVQTEKVLKR